jgi:transcriptional regulator with XRE-family HTH domain
MTEPQPFGARLRHLRVSRGWTQAKLARKAGIAAIVVSHYETGAKQFPSAATLVKLADALECTVDDLLRSSHGGVP